MPALSLCAVFHTAFLVPASDLHQTILDSLELLSLAAGISVTSGLIFRESVQEPSADSKGLMATLPLQVFYWASGIMLLLFLCCRYLETHCVFYRDIRRF